MLQTDTEIHILPENTYVKDGELKSTIHFMINNNIHYMISILRTLIKNIPDMLIYLYNPISPIATYLITSSESDPILEKIVPIESIEKLFDADHNRLLIMSMPDNYDNLINRLFFDFSSKRMMTFIMENTESIVYPLVYDYLWIDPANFTEDVQEKYLKYRSIDNNLLLKSILLSLIKSQLIVIDCSNNFIYSWEMKSRSTNLVWFNKWITSQLNLHFCNKKIKIIEFI